MNLFKNINKLKEDKNSEKIIREFEVITDADIRGGFSFGPYSFNIWESNPKKEGESRKLILKIAEQNEFIERETSKKAYYSGGDIADEIIILSSLFLRRRFKKGSLLRWNDKPLLTSSSYGFLDEELIKESSNLSDLEEYFNILAKLNPEYNQKFILSAKLYQQALLMIENEPTLAYLSLVSSIEVLSDDYKISVKFSDLEDKVLKKAVAKIGDKNVRDEVETAILGKEKFISKKFVEFIYTYTDELFWEYKNRPNIEVARMQIEDLKKYLKRIYNQRSKTLHEGELFPPSTFDQFNSEIPLSLKDSIGEKHWKPNSFVPNIRFFERLVNHVLINFLKKNQSQTNTD